MSIDIATWIKNFDESYSQAALVFLALITVTYALFEYRLRWRPIVRPMISLQENDQQTNFFLQLINLGTLPCSAIIEECVLTIGDEKYPTLFDRDMVLFPGEPDKIIPIGSINNIGKQKIIGHEYISNRVEIYLKIGSRKIGKSKKNSYKTVAKYQIDITQTPAALRIVEELFT